MSIPLFAQGPLPVLVAWLRADATTPAAGLADYGIAGLVALIFLGGIVYMYRRAETLQDARVSSLQEAHDDERETWVTARKALIDAQEEERRQWRTLQEQADARAQDERRRGDRLAEELSRSIQSVQTQAMAAVTEAQRLVRDIAGRRDGGT